MEETIYLQLEDGTIFTGTSFGAPLSEDVTGEVVFTTAMTGYLETLTDPSYYGQMVVQTFPLIGNYGVIPSDFEGSTIHLSAYIVKEYCPEPSNFRSQITLSEWLKQQKVPGIYGIDTRALTKKIRNKGVMNGRLTRTLPVLNSLTDISNWNMGQVIPLVSTAKSYIVPSGLPKFHVVLWDFGAKQNIIRKLHASGCKITVVPADSSCEEILALHPDGIMLSNGPGNPEDNPSIVTELAKICASQIPIFGICMGHQLMALANGAKTEKLKYGHRGANQPVKNLQTEKIYITSQNHGYAVINDSLPESATISYINLNDGTCEGIIYHDFPGFSVQFHPEACAGPHDTDFLFDEFISLMERSGSLCH